MAEFVGCLVELDWQWTLHPVAFLRASVTSPSLWLLPKCKNPSRQRPSNILLCSLGFTDFLTAFTAQPLGTLRPDDGDDNGNATKSVGLMSKTTILYVHHAFLYISLPSLHDDDIKMPNFTIYRGSIQATTKLSLFLNLDIVLRNSTLGGFAYTWHS